MYIQEFNKSAYETALRELDKRGRKEPLQAYHTALMWADGCYRLSLLPMRGRRIAVLQAVREYADSPGREQYELITAPGILRSLLDVWLTPLVKRWRE